jgi:peptidoglycan hydrolase CwlO-like protein
MVPDKADPPPQKRPKRYFPAWSEIAEFVLSTLELKRSVDALKKENRELDRRIAALQRQFDERTGHLKALSDFVNKALEERVEARAEEAALRAFERMATIAGIIPRRKGKE